MDRTSTRELTRQFLLGNLESDALHAFEERLFADSTLFEDVQLMEDQLIEEYLEGRLPSESRDRFERHFLASPTRVRHYKVTKALMEAAAKQSAPAVRSRTKPSTVQRRGVRFFGWPRWTWGLVAAALFLVVCIPLILRMQSLDRQLTESREIIAALRTSASRGPESGLSGRVIEARLTASLQFRGGGGTGPQSLAVPEGTSWVHLEVEFAPESNYPNYRVSISSSAGSNPDYLVTGLDSREDRRGRYVALLLPATTLRPGSHLLTLEGIRDTTASVIGNFRFVVRRP